MYETDFDFRASTVCLVTYVPWYRLPTRAAWLCCVVDGNTDVLRISSSIPHAVFCNGQIYIVFLASKVRQQQGG